MNRRPIMKNAIVRKPLIAPSERVNPMPKKKPKLVWIEWRDPESDWPWFFLLGRRGGRLHLQGADYPDGSAKHRGDCFWAHESDVRLMRFDV